MKMIGGTQQQISTPQPGQTVVERRLEIRVQREWAQVPGTGEARHAACLVCGEVSFLTLTETASRLGGGLYGLCRAIEAGSVHLNRAIPGQIRVCAGSQLPPR